MKKKVPKWVIACLFVIIALIVARKYVEDPMFRAWRTEMRLRAIARASTEYFFRYRQWPADLDKITFNGQGKRLYYQIDASRIRDGWGRRLIYSPFNGNVGYGSIKSLGRDGKLGGGGLDEDLELRFDAP